jgi:uncharacterized protein YndB with AHSA1/START domain
VLNSLLFVAAFCVVAVLVYMARYSSRLRVERSRLINAPLATVYAQVADLHHWNAWNPWLAEGTRPSVSEPGNATGSRWSWDSARAGKGQVTHLKLQDQKSIAQRIGLQHPFAVQGKSSWQFTERAGQTEVRWSLRARVGFSVRAFSQTIQQSLALDVRYGLDRLARSVEPAGAPGYAIQHIGVREVADSRYVYQTYEGPITGLPAAVARTTETLRQQLNAQGAAPTGAPMAVYVKTNIKLRTTVCHIGIPVGNTEVGALPVRALPAHNAYVVQLQGDRSALELAWYLAMQRMVAEDIKPDQRIAPVEHYLAVTAGSELTELHIPVLGP